jgi:ribonucleoside-diphosphate reductase alpha chain
LLYNEVRKVVRALNNVVDKNNYSTDKGHKGGLEQRAIAIGTQGLADVFYLMDYIFTSDEAKTLNKQIFETIYFAAITESNDLCKTENRKPYKFFNGSPMSKGEFQFDMWGLTESDLSGMFDWESLKNDVKKYGVCNSLFTAQMPVASSAKITGSFEMTEPAHSALFNRRVVGGEIMIVNKYLINDFEKIGIWCEDLKNEIIFNEGSVQKINFNAYLDTEDKNYNKKVKRIEHLIPKYKTIWEISQKELIDMAADRAPFIDQSQSMNIYMSNPTLSKISSSHFHSWKKGLKTLCYYVRTKAIHLRKMLRFLK